MNTMALRNFAFCLIFVLFSVPMFAQDPTALFRSYTSLPGNLLAEVTTGQTAVYQVDKAKQLIVEKPLALNLEIEFEGKQWVLELKQTNIYSKGFRVTTGSAPDAGFAYTPGAVFYNGHIRGKQTSFAAVSILEDRMMAVLADETGNINIGAVNTAEARNTGLHVMYRDRDLVSKPAFDCGVKDEQVSAQDLIPVYRPGQITGATVNDEPIDIYFEADFTTYQNNASNITRVVNYVSALFNVVQALYENDSINVKMSGLKVWDVVDPYVGFTTTSGILNAFAGRMSAGFRGDLAHFLSQRSVGGGIAFLNVLCGGNKTAVSCNLTNSFNPLPVYSWSTMVITHETGHNIGSPHTHNCGWPGGAIDNCYPTEGGCSPGPAAVGGGTIMSYCHLSAAGINLSRGFGLYPGILVRNRVRGNQCIYPEIYFESTTQGIAEENVDVVNGCVKYRELSARLKIPYPPSAEATVTVTATGSAGLQIGPGKDVEVAPFVVTMDSANLFKDVTIRVYDDAEIESQETLTLNFSVNANGGNALKRATQNTHTLAIQSTDHRPDSTNDKLLYSEQFESVDEGIGDWTQRVIYGSASANRFVVGRVQNALFPSNALYLSNNGNAWAYSGDTQGDSALIRVISPTINTRSFSNLRVSYVYSCGGEYIFGGAGTQELIGKDFGRLLYSIDNGESWTVLKSTIVGRPDRLTDNIALPADASNIPGLRIAFEWQNNDALVTNPPLLIDSILIKGTGAADVQTLADAGNVQNEYFGPLKRSIITIWLLVISWPRLKT